jgi:hypothetical protein
MSFPRTVHIHVKHWVLWWFYLGVVCGVVALLNIFLRDLSSTGIRLVLIFGVLHWVLGGVVCYCYDGVKIVQPPQAPIRPLERAVRDDKEWHSASDFVLPGNRKSIFPPRY